MLLQWFLFLSFISAEKEESAMAREIHVIENERERERKEN